jgi:hypothetical protein
MIKLPEPDGTLTAYQPNPEPRVFTPDSTPFRTRSILATAHVLGAPLADNEPFGPPLGAPPPQELDWEATLAFRRHLWSYGYTLCEGMDTAHRGMGLDWPGAAELIRRCGDEARAVGGDMVAAVLTDQLDMLPPFTLKEIRGAYEEQLEVVEAAGARPVIMCSPQLVMTAKGPDDYADLYGELIRQCSRPVILHWVTSEWDPRNFGYWGHFDLDEAYAAMLAIARANIDKVEGIKIAPAPLDTQPELRAKVPEGLRFYTSDTDDYPDLLVGDALGHSHALSPVFDAVLPLTAQAFRALDDGDAARAREVLGSTLELNHHLFTGPGRSIFFFRTGMVLLGWLAGHSSHFRMVWGEQSARSVPHLATAYRLADTLGVLPDPQLAESRMKAFLTTCGVEQ